VDLNLRSFCEYQTTEDMLEIECMTFGLVMVRSMGEKSAASCLYGSLQCENGV